MTEVRTIFFDLDDTLIDNGHAQREAMRDTYQEFRSVFHAIPLEVLTNAFEKINVELWDKVAAGEITSREYYQQRFLQTLQRVFGLTPLIKYDLRDAFAIDPFFESRYAVHVRETSEATETLQRLRGQFTLGVITNGGREIQHRKLAALGWMDYFTHIVTPDDAGAMKPHGGIFEAAENTAARLPEELVLVGDNFHNDVAPAKLRGWRTVWYNPHSNAAPDGSADAVVAALRDVADLFLRNPA